VSRSWCFLKLWLGAAHSWVNWVTLTFAKFLLFFVMPVMVKIILSKRTSVQVCLIIASTIGAFEWVREWYTLFGLKSQRVCFFVSFATPSKLTMMFEFMRTIVFNIFDLLSSIQKDSMFPLPAILILENTRVYVCTSDSGNIAFYVEAPVNQSFCFTTTLDVVVATTYHNDK